jgi:predicted NBD/HSP70 family sugar kinase
VVRAARALGMRPKLTARQVFDAARAGNEAALAVVEREGAYLAQAVAGVVAILDPELIVFGGGIGHNLDLLRDPIERHLREITPLQTRIAESSLGENAVQLGAIATALAVARDLVFQQRTGEGHSMPAGELQAAKK